MYQWQICDSLLQIRVVALDARADRSLKLVRSRLIKPQLVVHSDPVGTSFIMHPKKMAQP